MSLRDLSRPARLCVPVIVALALGYGIVTMSARRFDETLTSADLLQPADLAKVLATPDKPTIVFVGFKNLYHPGHIPGATMHGPTSTPAGLADLRTWADALPRTAAIVIYCGCCPLIQCPNVRPALAALKEMGFKNVRVVALTTSFGTDWVEKGLPIEH